MSIFVTKRDGSKEPLNIDKLHKVVFWATEGLAGVSASEVEIRSQIQFFDGMKTTDIQETLIKAASELISEDTPNYQYVAGRLVNYHLRKEVYGRFQPTRLFDLIKKNVDLGFYDPQLLNDFTEEEWDEIASYVNHERDMSLTYVAMEQMRGKYLVQNRVSGKILETPQVLYILVSAVLFAKYPKDTRIQWVRDYYESISKHEISLPTPIMSGVRTAIRQYSSCFPAGQLVTTRDGLKPIEEIAVGEFVLTRSGQYHRVLARQEKPNTKRMVSFSHTLFYDDAFRVTEDHNLWVLKPYHANSRKKYSVATWVEAGSLENGDFVHIPVNRDTTPIDVIDIASWLDLPKLGYAVTEQGRIAKRIVDPSRYEDHRTINGNTTSVPAEWPITAGLMRMIGYFLAEGHVTEDRNVTWTFSSKETAYIDEVRAFFADKQIATFVHPRTDNSTTITVHSRIVANLFQALTGSGFDKKRLHGFLMKVDPDLQREILIGVARGDGCTHRGGITLSMTNLELMQQLTQIALRCRLFPTLFRRLPTGETRTSASGRKITTRNIAYGMNLALGPNAEFIRETGKNLDRIGTPSTRFYGRSRYLDGEFFTTIRDYAISADPTHEPVYDLQVDNDQSFAVSNLTAHNCTLIECDDSLRSIEATSNAVMDYVSQRAGIGLGAGRIRALGSPVRKGDTSHTGVTPFFKHFQSAVNSCNQGGVRKGSATLYYPIWHYEVESMLVLKNNKGIEDNRVRHMDYGVQFSKLFYERLITGGDITLFSPNDVPEMYEAFFADQDRFKELYETAERNTRIRKKKIKAIDLFTSFMNERKDTGRIYLMNVDSANAHSSFDEKKAPIRMSNLCCEILLPTVPMGTIRTENATIPAAALPSFMLESAQNDIGVKVLGLDGDSINVETSEDMSRIALCTLSAINWGVIKSPADFERICRLAVRALDSLLDHQEYPVLAARKHTEEYRPLGIGIINLAYFLAKHGVRYSDGSALALVDEYAEAWSYYMIKASMELAKEKGPCKLYTNTKYSNGIVPIDTRKAGVDELVPHTERMDWASLRADLKTYGIRNATLLACMPAETSAQICNGTNGIEPPRSLVSVKQSKHGVLKQVVPEIKKLKNKYELLWSQKSPEGYLNICAVLQKHMDQTISVNTSYNPAYFEDEKVPMSVLLKDMLNAYKRGVVNFYYLNSHDGSGEIDLDRLTGKLPELPEGGDGEEGECDACHI